MPRKSLRAAATSAGCRHSYLSKLIKEGRLHRGEDGLIELDDVLKIMAQADPAQRRKADTKGGHQPVTPKARVTTPLVTTPEEAREAVALVARVLAEEGIPADGPPDIQMARLCEVILKSRERDIKIAERRKLLVPLAAVLKHVASAFVGLRRVLQGMSARYVPEMAARLGVDPTLLRIEVDRMVDATLGEMSAPTLNL